jgi:hypothetical protein
MGQELQHETSLKLAHLAQADAAGNRDMAMLADLTYKDSRTMRITTVIAMFYLPVNLAMVCTAAPFLNYNETRPGDDGLYNLPPSGDLLRHPTNLRLPILVIFQQYTCLVRNGDRGGRKFRLENTDPQRGVDCRFGSCCACRWYHKLVLVVELEGAEKARQERRRKDSSIRLKRLCITILQRKLVWVQSVLLPN